MKDIIDVCLSKAGVKYIAERVNFKSHLDYYKVTFKDVYGRYRKFEAFYNETDIFTLANADIKMIEGSSESKKHNNFQDRIIGGIRDYASFEDCKKDCIQNVSQQKIDSYLLKMRKDLVASIYNISVPQVSIDFVDVTFKPVCMVIIRYRVKGEFMEPIKAFMGEFLLSKEDNPASTELCYELNNLLLSIEI